MRAYLRVPAVLGTLLLIPTLSEAQVCTGRSLPGELGVHVGYATTQGVNGVSLMAGGEAHSGFGLGMSVAHQWYDESDETALGFAGDVSYSLSTQSGVSLCPIVEIERASTEVRLPGIADVDLTGINYTGSLGVGYLHEMSPSTYLVPHASAGITYWTTEAEASGESASDSGTEFGGHLGVALLVSRITLRSGVSLSSAEGSDPVFSVSAGIRFSVF